MKGAGSGLRARGKEVAGAAPWGDSGVAVAEGGSAVTVPWGDTAAALPQSGAAMAVPWGDTVVAVAAP